MSEHPDLVLRNARIWTGDASAAWADCAVVRDGRFTFVGRESDANVASAARTLDGRGRLAVPGFVDAHAHLLQTGMVLSQVDLKDCASAEDAAQRVAARVPSTPPSGWIRGHGWDQHRWPGAAFPDRHVLDRVAPAHPVALVHTSGHCVWVNNAALRAAGVDAATAAPEGGVIDRDARGEPSGILRDNAAQLVERAIPPPSPGSRRAALRDALRHAHAVGVTGVHAMNVGRGELGALRALHAEGALTLRTRVYVAAERLDDWIAGGMRTGDGDELLRIGGVKFFADGALGPLTAWMLTPYEGSDDRGLPLQPPDVLEERVRRCLSNGLAPAVHAIGDRANRVVLDIFERARDLSPALPRRVEHAQLLAHGDGARFAALGVHASMQPIHATQDMDKVDRCWGERGSGAYAFASLLACGASIAFGSDTPVETMDPIAGLHAAVTRRDAAGRPPGGWHPEQRIAIEAALAAYGAGAARAAGDPAGGRITPGAPADFVLLSRDLFSPADEMDMLETRAELTAVAGEVVFERP
jgi:predicted amidohydrolase YtcJ